MVALTGNKLNGDAFDQFLKSLQSIDELDATYPSSIERLRKRWGPGHTEFLPRLWMRLEDSLKADDSEIRFLLMEAILKIESNPTSAPSILSGLLGDRDSMVRKQALNYLSRVGPPAGSFIPLVAGMACNSKAYLLERCSSLRTLVSIGGGLVPALRALRRR